MKKKITKVEEPAAPYLVSVESKVNAPSAIRYADREAVRKSNAEFIRIHRKVLHKLAQ